MMDPAASLAAVRAVKRWAGHPRAEPHCGADSAHAVKKWLVWHYPRWAALRRSPRAATKRLA